MSLEPEALALYAVVNNSIKLWQYLRPDRYAQRSDTPRRSRPRPGPRRRRPRRTLLADAIHEFLNDADVRVQPDRRLRLLQIVEPLGCNRCAPTCRPCPVEELEVLEVENPSRPTTWKRTSLLGRLGLRQLGDDPQWPMMPLSNTIWAMTLWLRRVEVAESGGLREDLVALPPGQPRQEVGVVRRHAHEQAAAARVGHPLPRRRQLSWSPATGKRRPSASSGSGRSCRRR